MAADKDIIYVDIDDEITTIIDKVRNSEGKVVALVLPKRATVFQSVVNMKLLKRAAEAAKKHVVLVTTEANLMPLAGAVGLHVAPTPQSKPEIPAPIQPVDDEGLMDEPVEEEFTADTAGDRPVGELVKRSGHVIGGGPEAVSLDEEEPADDGDEPAKVRKNRHLHVPNFNKFRLRLFLAVLALAAIIVGLYFANVVLPHATIAITTNSSTVNVNLAPTLDTNAVALNTDKLIVPAKVEQQQSKISKQVPATGQKNTGDAATGSVTMTAGSCSANVPSDVPAGTGISTNGLTYISQEDASFGPKVVSGHCVWEATDIGIAAQNPGTKYNVNGATFSVAGRSDVTATGSASGGTDNVITVISQDDVDNAKKALATQDASSIKAALQQALQQDGLYPLGETFRAASTTVTTDKNVGDQADNVTVTQVINYTMFGVKKADLDALIKANIGTQIDTKSQIISNDGLGQSTINVTDATDTREQISLQTTATVGPDISVASIKRDAAGKRIGDVKSMIDIVPGVTSVDVQLSPFWVSTVPTNPHQVSVSIDKRS